MDPVADLLSDPRGRGVFVVRATFSPPWSVSIEDGSAVSLIAVVSGQVHVEAPGADDVRLTPGDIAVVRGPLSYVICDPPGTRRTIIVHPDQRCETLDGRSVATTMSRGLRTWGHDGGTTELLTGSYSGFGEIGGRLLACLPTLFALRGSEWSCPVLPVLLAEMASDSAGQQAVLDRLVDLVLVYAVRAWLDSSPQATPGWYRGYADPSIAPALRLMHGDLARSWTVESLARACGLSRAAFARRFVEVIGTPPMTHLRDWRLAQALDLVRDTDITVAAVARQVGYGSPFALTTAFTRAYGTSPSALRAAVAV